MNQFTKDYNTTHYQKTPEDLKATRGATILQVLPSLGDGGGVERGTVEIAEAINYAGGRAIVASSGGQMVHDLTRIGADHFTLPMHSKNPWTMYKNISALKRLILKENIDLIHARSRAPAWSAFYASKDTGIPFITTFHGTYSRNNFLKSYYNSVMLKGRKVIAISNFIAGHMRQYYGIPIDNIRVIQRGVDIAKFDPKAVSAERVVSLASDWRLPDDRSVIMLPGRLTRWKGQTVFIEAIAKLKRDDILALIVGSAQGRNEYRNELETLIKSRGLSKTVRIIDHCNDMPAAYKLTDLVVSASTAPEAFGRVIIEAQALGRPVIASDHGGARETIVIGETGWLVEPNNPNNLADAITRALSLNTTERATLAEKTTKHIGKNFSKALMCQRTLSVYDEVLIK